MSQVKLTGNTFAVKDQIKALGGRWDAEGKCWTVPEAMADRARQLVANAPKEESARPGVCVKCKGKVKPPYIVCFNCKNSGMRENQQEPGI